MNLSGEHLFRAMAYIVSLPVPSRKFAICKELLEEPLEEWPRYLTRRRMSLRTETAEYSALTTVEQILRGMAVPA